MRERGKGLGVNVVLVASSFARNVSGVMPRLNYQPGQIATTYSHLVGSMPTPITILAPPRSGGISFRITAHGATPLLRRFRTQRPRIGLAKPGYSG